MNRIFPRLIRLFLATTLIFVGVITHTGSVVHSASSVFSVPHEHVSPAAAKAAGLPAQSGSINFFESETDTGDPSHALGLCLDAHCCTPAVQMTAQDVLRPPLTSGKPVIAATSNYALSVANSLLRPPCAIA